MVKFLRMSMKVLLVLSFMSPVLLHPYPSRTNVLWFEVSPSSRNCLDIQRQGHNVSGVYTVFPYNCCPNQPLQVYCDMVTDGGGWTVIQRRDDIQPRENFYRTWMEYALGFGKLTGEFWLGLDNIHVLTDQALNELRLDMGDFENNTRFAQHNFFYVHDRNKFYKLEVNGYSGDVSDHFTYMNGHLFSAKDKELDTDGTLNCAQKFKGGWWYVACHESNPNGLYHRGAHTSYADGVNWRDWRGHYYSLKNMEIKIRPSY